MKRSFKDCVFFGFLLFCAIPIDSEKAKHKITPRHYAYDPSDQIPIALYNYQVPYSALLEKQTTQNYPISGGLYVIYQTTTSTPSLLQDIVPDNPVYLPSINHPPSSLDPIPTDDTVQVYPPLNQNFPTAIPSIPSTSYGVPNVYQNPIHVQIRVQNMTCLDDKFSRSFRAVLQTTQPIHLPPVMDDSRDTSDCGIVGSRDTFQIDLSGNQLARCGIRYCSSGNGVLHLCTTLRLPTLGGLKLPEDYVVNLQCKPQERVASHTKQVTITSSQNTKARLASDVVTGGSQRNFDSQVSLLRKAPESNDFTQIVTPGSEVQLGEDLLLKMSVRDGDGWKYSRLARVAMQRVSPLSNAQPKTRLDAVTMVDNFGCRVPSMKSVCPEHPRQVNHLVTTMPFRAFMFQGANSGDEMILSVSMLGCMAYEDCFQTRNCDDKTQTKTRVKRKIDIENDTETTNWQSYLEFKVVLPQLGVGPSLRHPLGAVRPQNLKGNLAIPLVLFGGLIIFICLIIYLILLVSRLRRGFQIGSNWC